VSEEDRKLVMDEDTRTKVRPALDARLVGRDRAYLIVLAGMSTGETFRLDADRSIIGRSPRAQVRLTDEGVSREHAVVSVESDEVFLEDLGSTNGTFCNGVRVKRRALEDGDKIMIGSTTILKFTYHDKFDEAFQKQMLESALRDGLTKVFNRKHFNDVFAKEFAFALRHDSPLSLLFIDIDHFKKVNDTYGHPAGDHVLSEISGVLAGTIRGEDVLARFGGEEFCVLSRGIDVVGARDLAERLRKETADKRILYGGKLIAVTISIGLASLPDATVTQPGMLLAAADRALYDAKRQGRNRVVVASPEPLTP
jgi:two-component system, cell cycle response regulator